MQKFDKSCGLSEKEIGIIKFKIKRNIEEDLPRLPDFIETKLYFQARDPWVYSWNLENVSTNNKSIKVKLTIKLKKEFHTYLDQKHYVFLCNAKVVEDLYRPEIIIHKTA